MSRQRLLIIVVPALVVGAIEVVSDTLLDSVISFRSSTIVMTLVVLVIAAALSGTADRRIELSGHRRRPQPRAGRSSGVGFRAPARERGDHGPGGAARGPRRHRPEARTLIRVDAAVRLLADGEGRLRCATSSGPTGAIDPSGGQPAPGGDDILRYLPAEIAVGRLVAPLQRGRETIGLLAIGSRVERSFDVDDVETLASLADQAAIAIEHARLQDRLRERPSSPSASGSRERCTTASPRSSAT